MDHARSEWVRIHDALTHLGDGWSSYVILEADLDGFLNDLDEGSLERIVHCRLCLAQDAS